MAVNTISDLTALLADVDYDANVFAAIVNDASTTTDSPYQGAFPGTLVTRSGLTVKNIQRVIADFESEISESSRPDIQDEGIEIVANAETINFVGTPVTVTDVAGVATVTVSDPDVTKSGVAAVNQIAVWTGDGPLEGNNELTWNGTELLVSATTPVITFQDTTSGNLNNMEANADGLVMRVDADNLSPNTGIAVEMDGFEQFKFATGSLFGVNEQNPQDNIHVHSPAPFVRFEDFGASGYTRVGLSNEKFRIDVDPTAAAANSEIQFLLDGAVQASLQTNGNFVLVNGFVSAIRYINPQTGTAYTLDPTDTNAIVTMDNAAANTLTIDPVGTTAYPIGTVAEIHQLGAGVTTIQAAVGVTLNGVANGSGAITAQYGSAYLRKVGTDVWTVNGDIGAIA